MITALDHWLFGNGKGMKSPFCDDIFYWLNGEAYLFSTGLGAQLYSFQWTTPKPGEQRLLRGKLFTVFLTERRGLRVMVSWSLPGRPSLNEVRQFKSERSAI